MPLHRCVSLHVNVPLVERVLRRKAREGGKDSIRGREGWESKGLISQLARMNWEVEKAVSKKC